MRRIFYTAFDKDPERFGPAMVDLGYGYYDISDSNSIPDLLLLETDTKIIPNYDCGLMLNPNLHELVDAGVLHAIKFFILDNKTLQRTGKDCWIILGTSAFVFEQADKIVDFYYKQACAQIRTHDHNAAIHFLICAIRAQPMVADVPLLLLALDKRRQGADFLKEKGYYVDYMCSWIRRWEDFQDKSDQEILEAGEKLLKQISGD